MLRSIMALMALRIFKVLKILKILMEELLQFVKKRRERLCLNVFVRNEKALRFYQKNDFKIIREQCEPSTAETELVMAWAMGCKSGFSRKHPGAS